MVLTKNENGLLKVVKHHYTFLEGATFTATTLDTIELTLNELSKEDLKIVAKLYIKLNDFDKTMEIFESLKDHSLFNDKPEYIATVSYDDDVTMYDCWEGWHEKDIIIIAPRACQYVLPHCIQVNNEDLQDQLTMMKDYVKRDLFRYEHGSVKYSIENKYPFNDIWDSSRLYLLTKPHLTEKEIQLAINELNVYANSDLYIIDIQEKYKTSIHDTYITETINSLSCAGTEFETVLAQDGWETTIIDMYNYKLTKKEK